MASDGTDPADLLERRADDSAGEDDDAAEDDPDVSRPFMACMLVLLVVWGPLFLLLGVSDRRAFAWGVVTSALYLGIFGTVWAGVFDPLAARLQALVPDISPLLEIGQSAIETPEVWIAIVAVAGIATMIGIIQIRRILLTDHGELME